jgi:hypothetical protein
MLPQSTTIVPTGTAVDGLLARLESEFTTEEQALFLQSFSVYLNNNPTDFVVDLDDVWHWMGFSTKGNAKALLLKYFTEANGDFQELAYAHAAASSDAHQHGGQNRRIAGEFKELAPIGAASSGLVRHGGHNRRRILLSLDTFEDFCMRAGTPKAQVVRTYFRKMNRIAIAHIKEREADSVLKLAAGAGQTLLLENKLDKALADQRFERSRALVDAFDHIDLVYAMYIDVPRRISSSDRAAPQVWLCASRLSGSVWSQGGRHGCVPVRVMRDV